MKALAILAVILAATFSLSAASPIWQELSSHLFTNAVIVWQAPANSLPKSLWIYQRVLPHIFSATVISNGIVLGSLQSKGFPKPSTNQTCIVAEPPCPCVNVCNFFINPGDASMSFESPNYKNGSSEGIPSDPTIARLAWYDAPQLGLDPSHLIQTSYFTHSFNVDQADNEKTNFVCGRGVFLARQLDGVAFFSADNTGDGAEGFSIEFGGHGQIRFFSLRWSDVRHYKYQSIATLADIIHCIKAHKIIVLPNMDEDDYFARLKKLATAKKLTITKITPCYGEGVFGETPTNDVPCEFAIPFAELEAVADFGNSNTTIRFVSPLLSSEVSRLLGK